MPDSGEGYVGGEAAASADSAGLGELASAVVSAARLSACGEWGREPRLYALARKAELERSGEGLPEPAASAAEDALILIEQAQIEQAGLRQVDLAGILARVRWPPDVAGCLLVTEVVVSDDADSGTVGPGGEDDAPPGRLTVGVLRDGEYACCLEFRGELIVGPDLADDLVTVLLGTL